MPFLNEGSEVANTAASIRETAGHGVDLILVNDASDDAYGYEAIAREHDARLVQNNRRLGCSASRDIGVSLAATEYVLLLDAHMRFYDKDWHREMVRIAHRDPRAIFCARCVSLDAQGRKIDNAPIPEGAYLAFDLARDGFDDLLEPKWSLHKLDPHDESPEIACVLGAAYFVRNDYYQRLRGLEGLFRYGGDEAYLSLKAWLEGGRCRLLSNIHVGHIFRETAPFPLSFQHHIYNKMVICLTLFPENVALALMNRFSRWPDYRDALDMCRNHTRELTELRKYYRALFTRPLGDVLEMQAHWMSNNESTGTGDPTGQSPAAGSATQR